MISLHFGPSRLFRRVFLAASLVFWLAAAAIASLFLVRAVRGQVKGGITVNIFVATFTLVWFLGVHAMVMTVWKADSLAGGVRFWPMVFAPRPAGALEASAWRWARTFLASWLLCVLMILSLGIAEKLGFHGVR